MQHSPRFLALVQSARRRIRELSIDQLLAQQAAQPDLVLIDVREDREWHAGHITGAVHLGKGIIERDIEARYPNLDTELVLYCGGGYRSALAADALGQLGYRRVASLQGGWREWTQRSLPTERDPQAR